MALMFLDPNGGSPIARYDQNKYPIFHKLTKKMRSFDWQPDEIDVTPDAKDFRGKLGEHGQHIFTSNIKRQIVLDTKQGSAPSEVLAPIVTQPDLEVYVRKWSSNEDVHSETYTHIITNVYPNPSKVFDDILSIEPIMKMQESISKPYDDVDKFNKMMSYDPDSYAGNEREHKKALWMAINSINALEGIRFYVSFACSWAFAELKMMKGNADLIKLIARDENVHLAGTQNMLKYMPQEDPDFASIREEMAPAVLKMFTDVVDQEIEWAKYLFKDGSMIGLNYDLLAEYVMELACKRLAAIGIKDHPYKSYANKKTLPWTQKWIAGGDVQVAPQEKQITMYLSTAKKNADPKKFEGFAL